MNLKVALLLADGFEEIEAITPTDLLRRAGIEVLLLSVGNQLTVTGKNGIRIEADGRMTDFPEEQWDLLVLPGGPGTQTLRDNKSVLHWVQQQKEQDRWLGAICAAPTVLQHAGVLDGHRYTAHFSVADQLQEIENQPVVVDKKIVTSMGAGTALAFGLELIEVLLGPEASAQVAESICEPEVG